MRELFRCPKCNKKYVISIRSMIPEVLMKKIVFYAKCEECGYRSMDYDTSNEVIEFLYNQSKEN